MSVSVRKQQTEFKNKPKTPITSLPIANSKELKLLIQWSDSIEGKKKGYSPPPTVGDFALKPKGQLIHQTKVWRRKMLLWIASDL